MISRDLIRELRAALRRTAFADLTAAGLSPAADLRAGGVAVAPCVKQTEGRFRFADPVTEPLSPLGARRTAVALWAVVGVHDAPPLAVGAGDGDIRDHAATIVDLAAWPLAEPGAWRLRTGIATWLNRAALVRPWDAGADGPPDLRLYPHPAAWLRAGAPDDGAVWLRRAAGTTLRTETAGTVGRLLVEDAAFAERVYKDLRRPWPSPPPPVFVIANDGIREEEAINRSAREEPRAAGDEKPQEIEGARPEACPSFGAGGATPGEDAA